jgi:hypothetical protein
LWDRAAIWLLRNSVSIRLLWVALRISLRIALLERRHVLLWILWDLSVWLSSLRLIVVILDIDLRWASWLRWGRGWILRFGFSTELFRFDLLDLLVFWERGEEGVAFEEADAAFEEGDDPNENHHDPNDEKHHQEDR